MSDIFNTLFYQPLLNALSFLYENLPGHDFGVAVIVLTLLVKLVLYPLGAKGIKSQKALQDLQPKIKEIQERFKNDKNKQAQEVMDLYKKEKINPFSGFALLIVQLPILFALFRVFGTGLDGLGNIDLSFLGIVDLSQRSIVLVVLAGLAQFWQGKTQGGTTSGMMQKQILYLMPLFTVFILWRMPSAIALYWLATALFTIGQQYITLRKK